MAAKHGRANLQGLGYGWMDRSIEDVIALVDGEMDGADRAVELPENGWMTVRGRTADLAENCKTICREGGLQLEIERFKENGDCVVTYCRSTSRDK